MNVSHAPLVKTSKTSKNYFIRDSLYISCAHVLYGLVYLQDKIYKDGLCIDYLG